MRGDDIVTCRVAPLSQELHFQEALLMSSKTSVELPTIRFLQTEQF